MDYMERKKRERARRLAALEKRKRQQEEQLKKAHMVLDQAKTLASNKKFQEAKVSYEEASKLFAKIGWDQQSQMLQEEANNMDTLKKQYQQELQKREELKRREQDLFRFREEQLREKEAERKRLEKEAKNRPPPEIQRKIDESNYLLKKAQDREAKGKLENALKRYKYILKLYNEIGYDDSKKSSIEAKIADLKEKINHKKN